jgi:DNA repair protein RadD
MDLRPYQLEAVEQLRNRYREGAKRALLICPTGGGKTVIFSHVAGKSVERGSRVIVIAHRRELVKQASDKLAAFGLSHGIIQAGFRPRPHCPVQVASIQTLLGRATAISRADLVVIDEAHHVTTKNGYSKVLARFPEAKVLGVTATPWRLDGKGLGDVFDAHVVARTPRELRDDGFLVPVGGWEYEAIDTSSARVQRGDFVVGDLARAATSARVVGDIVGEWLKHAAGRRTVLFALSIEHSQYMVEAFKKAGVAAEHVDGEMPTADRDAVLQRLRAGVTHVVCNCNVLTEGFDCPELECCILARPTLSLSLALQMVGRVLRPAPGKAIARIHDHAGVLAAHGHPYASRDYSPETSGTASRGGGGGSLRRMKCKQCKAVVDRWPCEACGYMPKPEELQLEEVPAAAKREITNDGAGARKVDDDATRAETWRRVFAHDEARQYGFFQKMVAKHGLQKGCRVFWWFSGKTARPPQHWVDEARARAEGTAA